MATVLYPPHKLDFATASARSLFLAGSIEMGIAENWQAKTIDKLMDTALTIFNPRRLDWDSSWVQEASNPPFREQVDWELEHLEQADMILFYFDPNTRSPITLLELGFCACSTTFVVCPYGFWRRGNVEIFCNRLHVPFFDNLDDGLAAVRSRL